uniref:Uncharacterized protein n=1 Tax=Arundo donax TaxID=35708 RepID=A0A0A9TGU7_ARUDO
MPADLFCSLLCGRAMVCVVWCLGRVGKLPS